jgi:hypothetical protein
MDTFIHLQSSTMEPCSTSRAFLEAATWVCAGCRMPRNVAENVSIVIDGSSLKAKLLTFVSGLSIGLMNEKLLGLLNPQYVSTDLILDPVYDLDGALIEEWKAFRAKERVIIRGSKNVTCRVCTECGRNVYFAMGKRYLSPAPSGKRWILGSDLYGLVIPQSDFDRFEQKELSGVTIDKLEVREVSNDGLGAIRWNSLEVTIEAY